MGVVIHQHDPIVLLGAERRALVHRGGEAPVLLVLDQERVPSTLGGFLGAILRGVVDHDDLPDLRLEDVQERLEPVSGVVIHHHGQRSLPGGRQWSVAGEWRLPPKDSQAPRASFGPPPPPRRCSPWPDPGRLSPPGPPPGTPAGPPGFVRRPGQPSPPSPPSPRRP